MPAPFDGDDLKSTHKAAAALETAISLQSSELAVPEETRPNNVTITFDTEAATATVTMTLPIGFTTDAAGRVVVEAIDYIPGMVEA